MESNHGLENYGQDLLVLILEHSNSDFFFLVFFNHRTCLRSLSVLRSPAFLGSKQPTTFNYYCTTACLPRPRDPHGSAGGTNLDPPAPRVLALRHRDQLGPARQRVPRRIFPPAEATNAGAFLGFLLRHYAHRPPAVAFRSRVRDEILW
jgi:hypothetical protein